MRVLLTGASGQLGAYLIDRLIDAGHDVIAWSGTAQGDRRGVAFHPIDLNDLDAIAPALERVDPDALIHAAAISSAEGVRINPVGASKINVDATGRIAEWSAHHDRRVVFTSTDLVFNGTRPWNREVDTAEPVLAYGITKRRAELAVLATSKGVIARLSLLFGPSRCGRPGFFDQVFDAIRRGEPRAFFEDEYRTPLDLATAAQALVRLVEGDWSGLIHVAGRERMSRFELMRRAATALGLDDLLVRPNLRGDVALPEPRPADVSLDTTLLSFVLPDLVRPSIEEALRPR